MLQEIRNLCSVHTTVFCHSDRNRSIQWNREYAPPFVVSASSAFFQQWESGPQVYQEEELRVRVAVTAGENAGFQFKTHPNIDKSLYAEQSVLGLKDPTRPFPAGNPLGILKWRYQVWPARPSAVNVGPFSLM